MKYFEKLKNPLWQKKRLTILNRDSFKCRDCGTGKKTLHVHHLKYIRGREPWDYENSNFLTLCDRCHDARHSGYVPTKDTWKIIFSNFDFINITKLLLRKITKNIQCWIILIKGNV